MQGPVLWWLSFCDPDLPSGSQFLGCAIVRGLDMVSAIQEAHRLRCNPGGQVQGQPIYADLARRIPPHRIGVLLDREAAGNVESELLPEGGSAWPSPLTPKN